MRLCKIIDSLIIHSIIVPFILIFINKHNIEIIIESNDKLSFFIDLIYDELLYGAWFLKCLAITEILYLTFYYFLKIYTKYILFVICLIIFLFGFTEGLRLPWNVSTVIYAMVFFSLGKIYTIIEHNYNVSNFSIFRIIKFIFPFLVLCFILIGNVFLNLIHSTQVWINIIIVLYYYL